MLRGYLRGNERSAMPRGKGIYDNEKTVEPTEPDENAEETTDQENTPDVANTDQEPTG
jgi:hypothetical protein